MLQNGKISLTQYLVIDFDKEPKRIYSWISCHIFSNAFYEFLMFFVVAYSALQEVPSSNYGVNTQVVFQVFPNDLGNWWGKRACSNFDVFLNFLREL
jgi:hypothetical protein